MLVLLPPSEGKSGPDRGAPLSLEDLSFDSLTPERTRILDALVRTCSQSPARARTALGLSAGQAEEIRRNAELRTAPAAAARRVYSGVLYEAWDPGAMDARTRRRADRRLAIASALFGLLRPGDRIPAYRLSADARLPRLGPLRGVWREPVSGAIRAAARRGIVLDLRSGSYVALGPVPVELAPRTAVARVLQERGGRRSVVSHHNKATKGLLVRALLGNDEPADVPDLAGMLGAAGHRVEVRAPERDDRPWTLDIVTRA